MMVGTECKNFFFIDHMVWFVSFFQEIPNSPYGCIFDTHFYLLNLCKSINVSKKKKKLVQVSIKNHFKKAFLFRPTHSSYPKVKGY